MNTQETVSQNRQAAVAGLAIVGFVALVVIGIWLAVYSARFVPSAVGRIGTAAVSLASIFNTAPAPSLAVVSTASTTIPFGNPATTTVATTTPVRTSASVAREPGQETSGTYTLGTAPAALYGLPDLTATIDAVGYLSVAGSASSFVASPTVPAGDTPAVQFTIKNIGTNVAGSWEFKASLPTTSNQEYQSLPQQSLNPGDYIDYTLGFTEADIGTETVTVTANYNNSITESNTNNDSASAQLDIQ